MFGGIYIGIRGNYRCVRLVVICTWPHSQKAINGTATSWLPPTSIKPEEESTEQRLCEDGGVRAKAGAGPLEKKKHHAREGKRQFQDK